MNQLLAFTRCDWSGGQSRSGRTLRDILASPELKQRSVTADPCD